MQFVHHGADDAGVLHAAVGAVRGIGVLRRAEGEGGDGVVVFAEALDGEFAARTQDIARILTAGGAAV